MSVPSGAIYALLAGVSFGAYIFVFKRYFGHYSASGVTGVIYGLSFGWYLAYLLISGSFNALTVPRLAVWEVLFVVVSVLFFVGALFALYLALYAGDISYVTPISKISPVIVLPLEILLLNEYLTPVQITGVVCTTIAVYIANYQGGPLLAPFLRVGRYRPAQLALLSAALIAIFQLSQRVILQDIGLPLELWVLLKTGSVGILLVATANGVDPTTFKDDLPSLAGAALFVAVGEVFAALGFALVPASIASPLVSTQAIVAVILGGILLNEEAFIQRFVAASLAVLGVWLIAG
jgi:drug/metabolite transporter (DMT)-like permease